MDIEKNRATVQLVTALTPILERLQQIARTDPTVCAELRRLGEALIAFAIESQPIDPPVEIGLPEPPVPLSTVPVLQPTEIAPLPEAPPLETMSIAPVVESQTTDVATTAPLPASPSKPAKTRQPQPKALTHTTAKHPQKWVVQSTVPLQKDTQLLASDVSAFNLSELTQRCAIKKEGSLWALERQARLDQGITNDLQLESYRQQLCEHAELLPDCYLWMCPREATLRATAAQVEQVVGGFAVMIDAADLLHTVLGESEEQSPFLAEALTLAAQAQATLRKAVAAIYDKPDGDQMRLFHWLKSITTLYHIKISYMTTQNTADPAAWSLLQARIGTLIKKIQTAKQRAQLMMDVQRHCKMIQNHKDAEGLEEWQRLVVAVTDLIGTGLPPSNPDLRKHLLPVIDDLPELVGLSPNFYLVLRELDRFLAKRPPSTGKKGAKSAGMAPIAEVQRVRTFLHGRAVLLIGGERRPSAIAALTQAFDLKELIWIESYEKTHINFEPHVARKDVAVVILAIRWIPHSYGEVKEFCDQYDKPFVRLLAGYNPNQVAYTILDQVSHRFGGQPNT